MSVKNPFPGLRSFNYEEYELFFGRDEQYEQMVNKLSETRFLAVVGTSGSGKSSLVKAGLYPALYGGMMMSAGPNWRIAEFRPKDDPIRELAFALNKEAAFGDKVKENSSSRFKISEATNWIGLCSRISEETKDTRHNPSGRILNLLSPDNREMLSAVCKDGDVRQIVNVFNGILETRDFYQQSDFQDVPLSSEINDLLLRDPSNLANGELEKLNRLLLEASFPDEIATKQESQAQITEVTLRRGDLGLIDVVREAKMAPDESLLVVVDQFEELFRYARISEHGPHGNQAAAFVKLLLEASTQEELPIYVVLTMRSDYLGDCSKFWGLPEAINEGQYLIPRLTRDQRREAIMGPIGLRGVKITPQLVNQLLNDMGDDPDQLPILQHALMRTFDRWEQDNNPDAPVDVKHYNAIGKMAEALSKHADEAYSELPDERRCKIAERLFRSLTERGTGHIETRRPTRMNEIQAITEATFEELVSVIDVFRKEGRSFLLPPPSKELEDDTLIDISHESLIRNWSRMKEWVDQEARSADVYRRLVESARLYDEGETGVLSDKEIDAELRWKEDNKPNVTWASRYHLGLPRVPRSTPSMTNGQPAVLGDREIFENAMGFLAKSQAASRKKARTRQLTKALIAASVLLVAAIVILWTARQNESLKAQVMARLAYSAEMKLAEGEYEKGNYAELSRLLSESVNRPAVSRNWFEQILFGKSEDESQRSLRGFELNHLWKLSHGDATTLGSFNSPIASLEYLNSSHTLAMAQRDGSIILWDLTGGNWVKKELNAPPTTSFINFSTDRKTVAIAEKDGSIALWELNADATNLSNQLIELRRGGASVTPVNSLAYSPDKRFVAAGTQDGFITVWTTDGKVAFSEFMGLDNSNKVSLAFSSDSQWLAVGYQQNATLIDPTKKQKVSIDLSKIPVRYSGVSQPVAAPITCLAFSPDGKILAMGRGDASIALWDLSENKYLTSLIGHSLAILKVVFDQETGMFAAASRDGTISLWEARKFSSPEYRSRLIQRSNASNPEPDANNTIDLAPTILSGHTAPVTSLAFIGDRMIVSGSDDKSLKKWSVDARPSATRSLGETHSPNISSLAFSSNGVWLAAGRYDGSTTVWDLNQQQSEGIRVEPPVSGEQTVTPVAFSREQVLAVATGKSDVTLWSIGTVNQKLRILSGKHTRRVMSLAFSDDGHWLATGGADNAVWLWEVATGKAERVTVLKNSIAVLSLAFRPNSKILAIGSSDKSVLLWDLDAKKQIRSLEGHTGAVTSIAFSADGQTMATGSADTTVLLWDAGTYTRYATLQGPQKVVSLAFFRDAKRLATAGDDGRITLWDSDREGNKETLRNALVALQGGGAPPAFSVAVSPDGSTLATGNFDGTVLLRYAAPNEQIDKQSRSRN
jgi:WD40 repeat protein/energy-coupling factor transporter ATP-binding protein EcfA2